ncbi:MAG: NUDIX hydrolase [Bacteroidales bacterium]
MVEAKRVGEIFKFCPKCGAKGFAALAEREFLCKSCKFNFFMNASGAATAVIFNEAGELLLCRRAREPFKGTYELPGGFLEFGETAEEAVKREVYEELNIELCGLQYLGTFVNKYPFCGLEVDTIELVFRCDVKDFSSMKVADDVDDFKFVPLRQINMSEISSPAMRDIISRLVECNTPA